MRACVSSTPTEAKPKCAATACAARCAICPKRAKAIASRFETLGGLIGAQVLEKGEAYRVRLNVGVPRFEQRALPFEDAAFVWVGNPHVVVFEQSLDALDLHCSRPRAERGKRSPGRRSATGIAWTCAITNAVSGLRMRAEPVPSRAPRRRSSPAAAIRRWMYMYPAGCCKLNGTVTERPF